MNFDPIREWNTQKSTRNFLICSILCAVLFAGLCSIEFHRQFCNNFSDLYIHALSASAYDFSDLHSITCRTCYPGWELLVALLMRTGLSLDISATVVTSVMKALCFFLMSMLLYLSMPQNSRRIWLSCLISFFISVITPVRISSINPNIYYGVGSITVWHNPTQQIVNACMLMLIPWLCHCRYEFDRMEKEGTEVIRLPVWKVFVIGLLSFGSVACKPTLMQCVLPAAFVWFLILLIRKPKHIRFYAQMVLAFLPSAAYFLLCWLYSTGVIVEYSSGAVFSPNLSNLLLTIRNALIMGLCPFLCLLSIFGKRLRGNHMLTISLLMVAFAIPEAAWFYETGLRSGHGNFNWALFSAILMFWVSVICAVFHEVPAMKKSGEWNPVRTILLWCGGAAGLWHLLSGVYYLVYLWKTGNSF